jgi:ADP-ribosylglycohydrolase
MSAQEIRQHYGDVAHYVEVPDQRSERWSMPGLHSDDTQQALVITETILECGRADPDIIGRKFLELARGPKVLAMGAHRGFGRNFQYTVASWKRGCRWNGGGRSTAGIGASMRVAPVGLAFAGDDAAVRENSTLQALVTHQDPRGIIASCVVAHMVGRASWTDPSGFYPESFLSEAVSFAHRTEMWIHEVHNHHLSSETVDTYQQFSKALESLGTHLDEPTTDVLGSIQESCEEISGYGLKHPCQGFALGGVIAAIFFFLRATKGYSDAVLEAIHAGGDTDSVGAIVGSLSGALHGYASIPDRWKEDLLAREQIELRSLALAGQTYDRELWKDLPSAELEWTLAEEEKRREMLEMPPLTEEELADLEEIKIRPIERPRPSEDRGRPDDRGDRPRRGPPRGRRPSHGTSRGRPRDRRRDSGR